MRRKSPILLAAVMLALPGCAAKQNALRGLEARVSAHDSTLLCGTLSTIEIEDARTATSDRALRVPTFSRPGQNDEVNPPLSDELREVIRAELTRRVHAGGPSYWARVRILKGVQRFRARTMSEEENVAWAAEVMLQRQDGKAGGGTTTAGAESEYSVTSINASRSFTDTLTRRVLQVSVADAFTRAAQPMAVRSRAECAGRAPAQPVTLLHIDART